MTINRVIPELFFAAPRGVEDCDRKKYLHFKDMSLAERSMMETFIRVIQKVPTLKLEQQLQEILNQK